MIIQNKIANEMAVFKKELLKEDKETIFNHAFWTDVNKVDTKIDTI